MSLALETVRPAPFLPHDLQRLDRDEPEHARIAAAIRHLVDHWQDQPSLETIAARSGLSPAHFQRVFKRWAGISPKRFVQYVTLGHAKRLLAGDASVLDTALDVGLSGPSRLHDLFVACEAMTPGEFKALDLTVRWGVHDTPLGRVLIGVTERGICWLAFVGASEAAVVAEFEREFAGAGLVHDPLGTAGAVRRAFALTGDPMQPLPLVLRGTNFQIKVWDALLRVPFGRVVSYGTIAEAIGQPTAVRAVGHAIGRNAISWLIPCHRVIRGTGVIHNYRWGVAQKKLLTAFEAALTEAEQAA